MNLNDRRARRILLTPVILALCISFPLRLTNACFGGEIIDRDYHFFDVEAVRMPDSEYLPYIIGFSEYHKGITDTEARKRQRMENLQEWSDFACGTDRLEDIYAVIYTSSISEVEALRGYAEKKKKVPGRWADNHFASGLVRGGCVETFDYIIYAKYCEPKALAGSEWEDEPAFDTETQRLIDLGKTRMMKTDNHFLRLRYMYQIVRLAHYADQYEYALELYEDLAFKVDEVDSIIKWWLLAHKAGCLKRLGRKVEANYLFSKVFRNSPGKREQVYRSFEVNDDDEWEACLHLCHSDTERSTLYAMRAMGKYNMVVDEMREIYRINPRSEFLTPLLVEEISNIEAEFLGREFRLKAATTKTDRLAEHKLIPLLAFVIKVVKERKVPDPQNWLLAQGYLEYLSRDLYAANATYARLREGGAEYPGMEKQLELFQLVLDIHAYTSITPEVEADLAEMIQYSEFFEPGTDFARFVFMRLADLYGRQGDPGKAFLATFELENLRHNPRREELNDLINLAEKEKKNRFEEYLLRTRIGEDYKSLLYEIKGTYHLSNYELSEALRAFNKVNPAMLDEEGFYPYHIEIKDCIHCEFGADTLDIEVDKMELTNQLLDYEYKAKTNVNDAAKYYFLLGAAYYNMSYYGHEYSAIDYDRKHNSWQVSPEAMDERIKESKEWGGFGNRDFTDLGKALFFFEQAKEFANTEEFAAKSAFMAAKCELAAYYQDPEMNYEPWRNQYPKIPPRYSNYYDLLIKKYAGTEFFEEAVEECKFFAYYVEQSR